MWGWGIEMVYLVCVLGRVVVHQHRGWFRTGSVVLVAFNFYTDFNYGTLGSGLGGQVAFAAITSFMVASSERLDWICSGLAFWTGANREEVSR